MEKNYKIQDIFNWWEKFNNTDIKISTEKTSFEVKINNFTLPHLLGLHYINADKEKTKGRNLYFYIKENKLSDEEILEKVIENNLRMLQSVSDRIDTFKYFMENLEKGIVVENTNTKTNIKSQNFIVEYKDNKILHLGLLNVAGEDAIVEYGVIDRKLETYFIRGNSDYFKDTSIKENIKIIEKYNDKGELEPFSFANKEINTNEFNFTETISLYSSYDEYKEFEDEELSFTHKL